MTEDSEARYRLPRTVTPNRYDLTLEPDLAAGKFLGSLDVAVTVHEPGTGVVLDPVDLQLPGGWIAASDGRRVEISKVRLDAETERAHLELDATVEVGDWSLHL